MKNKAFIPEDEFDDVPKSFSAESVITGVTSTLITDGIILNNLKEVELALRIHNGEMQKMPLSSLATNINLVNNIYKQAGPLGTEIALLASEKMMRNKNFVGTIMAEAKSNLATKGTYSRSYDYDGMGTNFLKTSVKIRLVENKFVLNINAAYVGNEPEEALASIIERPLAPACINIYASMSVVDGWWYNLNLEKAIADNGYTVKDIFSPSWATLAALVADRKYSPLEFNITKDDVPLQISISIDHDYYWTSDRERKEKSFSKAINGNLVGAAWAAYRDKREEAKPEERKLLISVRYFTKEKSYNKTPDVDPRKIKVLKSVANEIEKKIREKIA